MILRFNQDLTEQTVSANGAELAQIMGYDKDEEGKRTNSWPEDRAQRVITFDDPVLVTDNYQIGRLPSVLRDTIFALFSSTIKITEYDGTSLRFEQKRYPGVWGPSIDTLLFCRAINPKNNQELLGVKTALEVGCGSGFISKYILENAPELEAITLIDLNQHAVQCAKENIEDKRAEYLIGDATELMKGNKYDLIVCNPPYIPRPKSIDDNPYEGISLLTYLIGHAGRLLTSKGKIITNISSLCSSIVESSIREAGVKVSHLDLMEVPLKVFNVLNNPAWMDYLIEKKGLDKRSKRGYDYWHTIKIIKIEPAQ